MESDSRIDINYLESCFTDYLNQSYFDISIQEVEYLYSGILIDYKKLYQLSSIEINYLESNRYLFLKSMLEYRQVLEEMD